MIKLPHKKQRVNNFKTNWIPKLSKAYSISEGQNGNFIINANDIGIIDYFPKSDKVLIRELNEWIPLGLNWINENL